MRSSSSLDHLLAVAFMSMVSCGSGQGQEPKGSSEIVLPEYPQVPGFPMESPNEVVQTPNVAVYPAPKKAEEQAQPLPAENVVVVDEVSSADGSFLQRTYKLPLSTAASLHGDVRSFHATVTRLAGDEQKRIVSSLRAWEQKDLSKQDYSINSMLAPSLKPGLYEVHDGSLTRLLVVEENGVISGTMSYK